MTPDAATLSVLYLGGTGTISAACVRASVAAGMDVTVVNRGADAKGRGTPAGVTTRVADVQDPDALLAAIGDRTYDAVVDFLSFDAAGADRRVEEEQEDARVAVHRAGHVAHEHEPPRPRARPAVAALDELAAVAQRQPDRRAQVVDVATPPGRDRAARETLRGTAHQPGEQPPRGPLPR